MEGASDCTNISEPPSRLQAVGVEWRVLWRITLSCKGTWFTKTKSFRRSSETERLSAPASDWNDLRTGSRIRNGSQSFENVITLLFPGQKTPKTVESFSTVTTGRVGTWFEGRDVGSVSFRLLVWGSAFIATHQKPALFSEGPFCVCACVCVHTVRVTLWVSHSPLIFFISLRFHSHSLGRTARYSTWIFCAETHKLRRCWLSHFKSFGRYTILGGDLLFTQAKHVQREKRYLQVHWGESFPWDLWRRSAFLAPLTSPGQRPWQR